MLIGYESGSFVGAVPRFESPSHCAETAAGANVRQSGSSVGALKAPLIVHKQQEQQQVPSTELFS